MPSGPEVTEDDLHGALAHVAKIMSVPFRSPRWVKPTWWDWPLTVSKTRPVPAASGWIDYIAIQLGETNLAPAGYELRLAGYVATTETDPLTNGVTYRFVQNGRLLASQEFDITNTIERHVDRYSGNPSPWPAFSRKIFLTVQNYGQLVLQVNNPSGAPELCLALLSGYYFPNLGDLSRGSLERAGDGSESTHGR